MYIVTPYANPNPVLSGNPVELSGSANVPNVQSWDWNFGDGSPTETGQVVSHTYTSSGIYNATVSASGNVFYSSDVYLNTYIGDDFGNEVGTPSFQPGWDPQFSSLTIDDCSGYYVTKGSAGDTNLIPSGATATITGRFDFKLDFVMGCINGGNVSLDFELKNTSGTTLHSLGWDNGLTYNLSNIGVPGDGWAAGKRFTVRMTRGYALNSSGEHTQESVDVIRSYYLDNFDNDDNLWYEMSASPRSGSLYNDNLYIVVNHATYNGFSNFVLQADSGLPFEQPTLSSGIVASGSVSVTSASESNITGSSLGKGLISGTTNIVYKATPLPPSGSSSATYTPILINKRRYVYKVGGDNLQAKLMIYNGKKLSYLNNMPVEFWLNYDGSWQKYQDYTTNRYGMAHLKHSTDGLPNIDCCLGVARVIVNGITYNSNIVRFNFVEGVLSAFIIDAGPSGVADRSLYDTFEGTSRINSFDRMWGT